MPKNVIMICPTAPSQELIKIRTPIWHDQPEKIGSQSPHGGGGQKVELFYLLSGICALLSAVQDLFASSYIYSEND